jgi:ANTAR domain
VDLPTPPLAGPPTPDGATAAPEVAVTRTPHGWAVVSPLGSEPVGHLVEGLTLADLVTEELGGSVDPDRAARRSARGRVGGNGDAVVDPRDARIAALERTVAQLEHALAARVSIERAIGVLAERDQVAPKEAFDALRGAARSQGRPVAELAREVLDSLPAEPAAPLAAAAAPHLAAAPAPHAAGTPAPRVAVRARRNTGAGSVAGGRR